MFSINRLFKVIAMLAIFVLPAACIGPQPAADTEPTPATTEVQPTTAQSAVGGGELVGPVWELTQIATRDGSVLKPADSAQYTLAFGEDGRVAAQISCNRGTGSYQADGESLTFSMMASSMAACPPDSVVDDFVAGLTDATSYAVDGDTLRIITRTGVMTFTSAAAGEEAMGEAETEATAEPTEEAAVTGNVNYMVRMALPPGAVVTVRLVDISRADAPAELIAEQVITTEGQQVPIPFELPYDPSQIIESNSYAVQARIEFDGALRFISDTIIPVITRDAPTSDVEVMVVPVSEPMADSEPSEQQGITIVLPDGTECFWTSGATLAFEGERINYTCPPTEGDVQRGLLGDIAQPAEDQITVQLATLGRDDSGFTLDSTEEISFTAAYITLADGTQCAHAGEGATVAFDDKRLNWSCETGDVQSGLLGALQQGEAGTWTAEWATIGSGEGGFALESSEMVTVSRIGATPPAAAATEDTAGEEGAAAEESAEPEGETAATGNDLTGVVWQWQGTQMNDDSSTTPASPGNYTLEFAGDGRVGIQADCNRGTGPYTQDGNQITFGAIATTLMACPGESQADAFLQQLGQVGSYFITEDGTLVLELQVDSGSMTFAAAQ